MLNHDILVSAGYSYYSDYDYYERFLDCNGEDDYSIDNSFVSVTLLSSHNKRAYARVKCMTSICIGRFVDSLEEIDHLINDFLVQSKDYN